MSDNKFYRIKLENVYNGRVSTLQDWILFQSSALLTFPPVKSDFLHVVIEAEDYQQSETRYKYLINLSKIVLYKANMSYSGRLIMEYYVPEGFEAFAADVEADVPGETSVIGSFSYSVNGSDWTPYSPLPGASETKKINLIESVVKNGPIGVDFSDMSSYIYGYNISIDYSLDSPDQNVTLLRKANLLGNTSGYIFIDNAASIDFGESPVKIDGKPYSGETLQAGLHKIEFDPQDRDVVADALLGAGIAFGASAAYYDKDFFTSTEDYDTEKFGYYYDSSTDSYKIIVKTAADILGLETFYVLVPQYEYDGAELPKYIRLQFELSGNQSALPAIKRFTIKLA
jgi:hypothetical protein